MKQSVCTPRPRADLKSDLREERKDSGEETIKEEAGMVDIADLEDELKWNGSHRSKKDDELLMGNISVGDIDPIEIYRHLRKAKRTNPKAMPGRIFREEMWGWEVNEITGPTMRGTIREAGIPISPRGVGGPNKLGA